jgi:predicted XRE-type DNA-binding protein
LWRDERMAIDMEIYEKIRYMHEREGLSQRAIARTLGVSRKKKSGTDLNLLELNYI